MCLQKSGREAGKASQRLVARGDFKRGGADGWEAAGDELVMRIRMKMLCRSYRVDQSQPGHMGEDTGVKLATDGAGRRRSTHGFNLKKQNPPVCISLIISVSPIRANQRVMD